MTVTRKVIYDWGRMEIQESIPVLCSYLHICCLLLTDVNNIYTYRCLWRGHICGNPYKLKASLNPRCGDCISPTECLLSLSTSALNKTLTLVCRCNRVLNAPWGYWTLYWWWTIEWLCRYVWSHGWKLEVEWLLVGSAGRWENTWWAGTLGRRGAEQLRKAVNTSISSTCLFFETVFTWSYSSKRPNKMHPCKWKSKKWKRGGIPKTNREVVVVFLWRHWPDSWALENSWGQVPAGWVPRL